MCYRTKRMVLAAALAVLAVGTAQAITIEMVTVGDTGNAADTCLMNDGTTGYGSVSYGYQMGKYEVTAGQYTAFLGAVAKTDPYQLYNPNMLSGCGIQRSGSASAYTYSVTADLANRPVNYVSFWDAARFTNWLNNGQGNGDTETGAYTLNGYNGSNGGQSITRNSNARYFVPSENEWYKAAYYKGGGTNAGYWGYATQSNTAPAAQTPPGGSNSANYLLAAGNTTNIGAYTNSPSAYGTFDQTGNVWEWNETLAKPWGPNEPLMRGDRGGSWMNSVGYESATYRSWNYPTGELDHLGFRVAKAIAPPPAPPTIDPANPPKELATYKFVAGLKPSLQWQPLTVGADFALKIPALQPFEYNPSFTIPKEPISPDIPAWNFSFQTNDASLGKLLAGLAPIEWNAISAEGKVGIQGGITAEAGVKLYDGENTATVGAQFKLGIQGYGEFTVNGGLGQVLHVIGSSAKLRVEIPIPGASLPPLESPEVKIPIKQTVSYPQFKQAIADALGVSLPDLKTTVTVQGVPITFNDKDQNIFVGVTGKAVLFAETSATFSLDAYFRQVTDTSGYTPYSQMAAVSPILFSQSNCFTSDTGSIQFLADNSAKMTTGSPVWLTTIVSSTLPIKGLLLNAQFDPNDTGEGIMSVYLNGKLIGLIDEAAAGHNVESYLFGLDEELDQGSYTLSYRLDPSGIESSSVLITNSSLVAVPEPSTIALLGMGVIGLLGWAWRKRKTT